MVMPFLTLTLFGQFVARYDDRPLNRFSTDKVRALLACLATKSGKPHRRETLVGLLWPDYPDGALANAVRLQVLDPRHERKNRQIMLAQRQKWTRPGVIGQ